MLELGGAVSEPEVVLRPFAPGDEVAVNAGFNQVFGTDRAIGEWGWKFPLEPGGRAIMLALRDDELLAHYAGAPVRFQVDGRVWPAVQIVDVFSTPAGRSRFARRGVWVQTVEAFFAAFGTSGRYPLLFGFPGLRALRLGVLQLGYDALPPQPIASPPPSRGLPAPGLAQRLYRAELARDWEPRLDLLWERVLPASTRWRRFATPTGRCRRLAGRPPPAVPPIPGFPTRVHGPGGIPGAAQRQRRLPLGGAAVGPRPPGRPRARRPPRRPGGGGDRGRA